MRDFNFFRSYQKKRNVASPKLTRYGLIALVAVILVGAVWGVNFYRISQIKNNMKDMQSFMAAPENVAKYKLYLKEKEKLAVLTAYYDAVSKINNSIENKDQLNTKTLDVLLSTMPSDVMLQTMQLKSSDMAFQGVSKSHAAIAEFEHNLKESGLYSHVLVSNITRTTDVLNPGAQDLYLFAVTCKVKGGTE